jgi:hypothetical protein
MKYKHVENFWQNPHTPRFMKICSAVHGFYETWTDAAGVNNHIIAASPWTCTNNNKEQRL